VLVVKPRISRFDSTFIDGKQFPAKLQTYPCLKLLHLILLVVKQGSFNIRRTDQIPIHYTMRHDALVGLDQALPYESLPVVIMWH
jgi:hypothetical protein